MNGDGDGTGLQYKGKKKEAPDQIQSKSRRPKIWTSDRVNHWSKIPAEEFLIHALKLNQEQIHLARLTRPVTGQVQKIKTSSTIGYFLILPENPMALLNISRVLSMSSNTVSQTLPHLLISLSKPVACTLCTLNHKNHWERAQVHSSGKMALGQFVLWRMPELFEMNKQLKNFSFMVWNQAENTYTR